MATTSTLLRALRLALFPAALLAADAWAAKHPAVTAHRGATTEPALQCQQVRYLRPPPGDLARAGGPARCDAAALYYDTRAMDRPADADWDKVRECAFRTGDSAVLMMLYANGSGVAPNLGLAMKYACAMPSTPAELRNRLVRLKRRDTRTVFDQCDDAGPALRDVCAAARERQGDRLRNDDLAALTRAWTPKERVGLDMVREAMQHFAEHRGDYETDQGSLARARLRAEALSAELDRFSEDLSEFLRGKTPRFSEGEYKALDDKMNQLYQQFMQAVPGPDSYLGSIRKSGVEKTQRAWLAYRDAMELFGSIKYPDVPASGWRALLTSRRIRQLSELEAAAEGR